MGLQAYRKKRKFDVTPEPRGHTGRAIGDRFVIQKHAARRLHYDLRLELDGVMKSWAVTRGPSLVPGEKRLAVEVEDHPIEYNTFEGIIPQGEYGGGTVMIWDRGRWFPEGDPHKALKKGHLDFTLAGEKLRGRWHLVRMRRRLGESKDSWLLFKARDTKAREPDAPDILEEAPLSVASGRSIDEIAQGKGRKRVWHSNRSTAQNIAAARIGLAPEKRARSVTAARAAPRQKARSRQQQSAGGTEPKKKSKKLAQEAEPEQTSGRQNGNERSRARPAANAASRQQKAELPAFVPPSLATLRAEAPGGKEWVHEIKFDGYRIQARLDNGRIRLLTRKGLDWTDRFPNIAAAVRSLSARTALIDGEVVVEDSRGISSFSGLQEALKAGKQNGFIYYVFDLLHRDGRTLTELPLVERKAELARLVGQHRNGIRYSEHFEKSGPLVLRHACDMGLEGLVSKRADASYRSGRSDIFIKTKCTLEQEFVVGGYSPSAAMPNAVGALVVGHYDDSRLIYAGRIGTGYTRSLAQDLWRRLQPWRMTKSAFDQIPRAEARRRDVHWVEPKMVIQAQLRGWTADGLVRQAAFKGVREDKPPQEVVREVPSMPKNDANTADLVEAGETPQRPQARATATAANTPASRRHTRSSSAPSQSERPPVRLTHPERVYWSDVGVSKQDLAAYYRLVWPYMARHLVDRPLALVRCPEGTEGECFFQKHASAGLVDKYLKTVIDKNRRQIIAIEDLDGLLSLVQAGVLEIHARGSLIDSLEVCDRIVFDLDPGPGVPWSELLLAARDVRARLAALDLTSFVKLSGGKGLHVVLPIAGTDWKTAKSFAGAVALAMNRDVPERYVAKITKSLRTGKIFVDYFRNSLEQTSIAAYSTRARPGAPVSVPLSWEDLSRSKAGNQYSVLNLAKRLEQLKQDPWAEMGRCRQKLPEARALRNR
jgi:bifunctional non-homologous end joining protein LigD